MSTAERVVFKNVSKRYGDVTAVDRVSFTVEKGTLVTLLGPSGCGKTTTLRMIAGLDAVTEGEIYIGDQEVTRLSASQRDVSMVFQSYALFPHMNILDNVAYGLLASHTAKAQAHERARGKMALLGLQDLALRLPSELSGGQQQRVAVARALVLEPQVLLFDEPLSNLDAKLRRQVRADIRALQQSLGLTVVYVTHDQSEALAVSDQVIVMSQARIAQVGTPRELYEAPQSHFIADFIGDANLIRGRLLTTGSQRRFEAPGLDMAAPKHCNLSDGPATLSVRPHHWTMMSPNTRNPDETVVLHGTVKKSAYLGPCMEYVVDTLAGELLVIDPNTDRTHDIGDGVALQALQMHAHWVA
ncbi:PotA ABC-type spermidine/putrescine transport systems, ATPase components [Burkholderiaceae bacterium]